METNPTRVQEQPAPTLHPDPTHPGPQSVPTFQESTGQPSGRLYDPAEASQIVQVLRDGYFDPEYVVLFGTLAGGTPHSEALAYDLLMVVRGTPRYDWLQAKRILRYRLPYGLRKITYINLYIVPLAQADAYRSPFLYWAHGQGKVLYCSDRYHFQRPRRAFDFAAALADARFHFEAYRALAHKLVEQARETLTEGRHARLAAIFMAQAAVYFYHALYYVYHGEAFEVHDPIILHERMRTLSTHLMLAFDDTHIAPVYTLSRLKSFLQRARYDLDFDLPEHELELHLQRVQTLGELVETRCALRLERYRQLSGL